MCSNCAAQANIPKTQEKLFLGDAFFAGKFAVPGNLLKPI